MVRLIAEWRSFAGVRPHRFCVALREGRKRAHLVSRLATVGLSPITGPESGGMAGCGGRQSRSSLAVPHVSGYRATTAATEDSPTPVGPRLTRPSTQEILSRRRQRTGNRLHWHSQWRWQAQPFRFGGRSGSGGLRNQQSRATAGLVAENPRRERTPCASSPLHMIAEKAGTSVCCHPNKQGGNRRYRLFHNGGLIRDKTPSSWRPARRECC